MIYLVYGELVTSLANTMINQRYAEFIGGYLNYRVTWAGDDLILTFMDEVTFDGVRAPWVAPQRGKLHLTLVRKED